MLCSIVHTELECVLLGPFDCFSLTALEIQVYFNRKDSYENIVK